MAKLVDVLREKTCLKELKLKFFGGGEKLIFVPNARKVVLQSRIQNLSLKGEANALKGIYGFLEIFINNGNSLMKLKLKNVIVSNLVQKKLFKKMMLSTLIIKNS